MIRTRLARAARQTLFATTGLIGGAVLAWGVLQGAPAFAQTTAPAAATATAPAAAPAKPALWVVRDADSTLYLFGTIHVLRPGTDWRTPEIQAAFDASSDVWMEIENPDDQSAMMPLIQQHGLSLTRPLSSLLTAEEFTDLDAAARSIGATGEQLNLLRPWLAALTLSVAPLAKAGYDPTSGVEMMLKAQAEAAGKSVHGLETLEKQIGILAGLPEAEQLIFLRSTLRDYDQAIEMTDGLVGAWAAGDVAALDRVAVADMKADSEVVYRALLVDRNADWAGQIEGILAGSGTAFIAVGAAHLAGEDSVQAMLQAKGVTVERLQ